MSYTIKLKHGSFFFAGEISITGKGSSVTVDGPLAVNTIRAINASEASGIIESNVPIYVEETVEANIFIQGEVAEEATEEKASEEVTAVEAVVESEEQETEKKGGRRTKRG
jgi:hypothetical protein